MAEAITKKYFEFTKKEKQGAIAFIVLVMAVFICYKYLYQYIIDKDIVAENRLVLIADSLKLQQNDTSPNYQAYNNYDKPDRESYYKKYDNDKPFTGTMFYFDPNTLSTEGWLSLGIKEKTIASMQKYIAKGGRFKTADDLNNVWGLKDDEKQRLIPYARIAEQAANTYTQNKYPTYEKSTYQKKEIKSIEINAADSLAYDALPGIGGGFASRIIKFRNKLGGFSSVTQLSETFGLPDSVYQKIKPYLSVNINSIHKININTATEEQLKQHPYIRWQLAKLMMAYKSQHGSYTSLSDLKKIIGIDEVVFSKIEPYLSL